MTVGSASFPSRSSSDLVVNLISRPSCQAMCCSEKPTVSPDASIPMGPVIMGYSLRVLGHLMARIARKR
jgi:hypothetical protein